MSRYHPWRILRDHYPDMHVMCSRELDGEQVGEWNDEGLELCSTLDQAERRCTITHEIVHLERGPVPPDPWFAAKEERVVDCITARRLISLESLIDALVWHRQPLTHAAADDLWVDMPTLQNRLDRLTAGERRYIEEELARRLG
ncbi:hypothetical protein DW322_11050 [Rhodococcus rhodnii]|uniref:IrrE N-terminal-like domain-containing protein n=2 Tax=Rhodococcus rhodnii TaxID=38312 RepID=R7WIE8_9NOCA|nr:hypothetical protein [Rhodococcus rhodnii]EOM74958.1 hypothetical protein Rrhod_3718 [Rhodococcus rhodnii LMG 5362]TXG90273.1 hypothetical protein DW322_08625 [Rhodococcus rhodnii]TXG90649.1 hypothetical protein DW322_11050 [Rhodococcus rhodnii]